MYSNVSIHTYIFTHIFTGNKELAALVLFCNLGRVEQYNRLDSCQNYILCNLCSKTSKTNEKHPGST